MITSRAVEVKWQNGQRLGSWQNYHGAHPDPHWTQIEEQVATLKSYFQPVRGAGEGWNLGSWDAVGLGDREGTIYDILVFSLLCEQLKMDTCLVLETRGCSH